MLNCNSCGKCCVKYSNGGLSASEDEIEFWKDHHPSIFKFVDNGNIWMDPQSGEQLVLCPWLRKSPNQQKYTCDIYDNRPDDCRHYPTTIDEMVRDGCEMIEVNDLTKPKRAQKVLDRMMANSRPSVSKHQ